VVINSNIKPKKKEEVVNIIVQCYSMVKLPHAGWETKGHKNVD
jgi:hypothetical protein